VRWCSNMYLKSVTRCNHLKWESDIFMGLNVSIPSGHDISLPSPCFFTIWKIFFWWSIWQ
jgi:hypothetical protein